MALGRHILPTIFVTAAIFANASFAWAGEISADPDVAGAYLFHYYASLPAGASDRPLICYDGKSIAKAEIPYGGAMPLAIRKAAALACQKRAEEFEVKDYGNARFVLDSSAAIPTYLPKAPDLRTAYASALGSQPKVYFIFGVLKPWDALLIAAREIEAMQSAGIQVIFAEGFTKADLYRVIADDSTYGIVLDSHGQAPVPFLGWGAGYWLDSQEDLVSPDEITKVSKNLKFFSALGCYGEGRAKAYREHLHLSRETFHFISGSHTKNVIDYYFRPNAETPYNPPGVWSGGEFSPGEDVAAAQSVTHINFAKLVEHLMR